PGSGGRRRNWLCRFVRAHHRTLARGAPKKMRTRSKRTLVRNLRVSNSRQRKQQHLLDVKVRSRKATQYRNRRILIFLAKIVLVLVLVIGAYLGVQFGAKRLFFENPDYQLRQIEVQTDGTLQREQILKVADV